MKVITIGSDRKIFEGGSAVRARVIEYAGLFEEYHLVILTRKSEALSTKSETSTNFKIQISKNCWVYPTNSISRWCYVLDAVRIARRILTKPYTLNPKPWAVSAQDPFESGLAAYFAAKGKAKLQVQIHTDFLSPYFAQESLLNKIRVLIARFVLPRADGIRVVSSRIRKSLDSRFKIQDSRIKTLPVFVDVEKIRNAPIIVDLHKKYPQFERIILVVSRLSREKNVSFAIDVFAELIKKYPKAGLVIVGSGSLKSSLRLKTINYKLQTSVIFEGYQSDIISYYKTADVFLQASLYEGYGLALVEAIAAGCPVVSSDVGIASEVAPPAVCKVNDKKSFVSKLDQFLSNKDLRDGVVREGRVRLNQLLPGNKSDYLERYKESLDIF